MEEHKTLKIVLIVLGILTILFVGWIIYVKRSKPKPVTLNYWGYIDEEKDLKPLIDDYQKKHPNVTIAYRKIEETPEEYEKTITDAIASGQSPDIFQVRNDWIPKHSKKLAPVPETTYKKQEFEKAFFEIAQSDLTYKDKIYAIPFTVDTLALFYNTQIFDEASLYQTPDTWDALKALSQKLKKVDGANINRAGIALGGSQNVEYQDDILALLMLQSKTKMVSTDFKKAYFNLSVKQKDGTIIYPGTNSVDFYTSFANQGKENYTWRPEMPNSMDAFASGKVAMVFGYASDIKKIKKATNEKLKFEVAPAPQMLGETLYYAKYWANAVPKDSKNQKTCFASAKARDTCGKRLRHSTPIGRKLFCFI